jgi:hypothetical protein
MHSKIEARWQAVQELGDEAKDNLPFSWRKINGSKDQSWEGKNRFCLFSAWTALKSS